MRRIYKWDDWFKKRKFTLIKGVDYWVDNYTIGYQIRNAATKRGLKITIEPKSEEITVIVRSN